MQKLIVFGSLLLCLTLPLHAPAKDSDPMEADASAIMAAVRSIAVRAAPGLSDMNLALVDGLADSFFMLSRAPANLYWRKSVVLHLAVVTFIVDHSPSRPTGERSPFFYNFITWAKTVRPDITADVLGEIANHPAVDELVWSVNNELKLIQSGYSPPSKAARRAAAVSRREAWIASLSAVGSLGMFFGGAYMGIQDPERIILAAAPMMSGLALMGMAFKHLINYMLPEGEARPPAEEVTPSAGPVASHFKMVASEDCSRLLRGR